MKKRTKGVLAAALAAAGVFLLAGLDARLLVRAYTVESGRLTGPVRLAVLTDLHACAYGEGQRELLDAVAEQSPDLVLLCGDIVDDEPRMPEERALDTVEALLDQYPGQVAAVIVEPVAANMGVVGPAPGFLAGLRALCDKHGALLIFDEVITGFRLALGGAQAYYGVTPDLSTFAKAIASGYPFGAVVGRREVMACGVPASGTFNGNPIGVAAALATIETLSQPGVYAHLEGLAQQLETGFRALARKYHRPLYLRHVGSIFILYFGFTEDVEDFRDWLTQADLASYTRFVAGCEEYGVRFTDRRGREYLSVAHTQEDIRRTLAVADQVLGEMERGER